MCEWRRPELLEENAEAWELWQWAQTQWRVSMSGPVGLDFPAVIELAEHLEIPMSRCLLRKMQALERHELQRKRHREPEDGHQPIR